MESTALRYHQHGSPEEVLQKDTLPLPPLQSGQLLVQMIAAPINPSDLGSVAGSYGKLAQLPTVGGFEGVGEVIETGENTSLTPGQTILFPRGVGTWRDKAVIDEKNIISVPAKVPPEQAAMATINPPTALLLLENFIELQKGDWIIQNAGNSAVAHYVTQLCQARGVRTINLVRDESWIEPLKKIGADAVFIDSVDVPEQVRQLTEGNLPKLALNSVGGESAIGLVKCLADHGTHVTFGGMTSDDIRFPTRALVFHNIRLVGFWLQHWRQSTTAEERQTLMDRVFELLADGTLHAPIEKTYPLAEFKDAIQRASAPHRQGKILFKP